MEYFLSHYHIDSDKVYLHGCSGGGEAGSLIMGMKPQQARKTVTMAQHRLRKRMKNCAVIIGMPDC